MEGANARHGPCYRPRRRSEPAFACCCLHTGKGTVGMEWKHRRWSTRKIPFRSLSFFTRPLLPLRCRVPCPSLQGPSHESARSCPVFVGCRLDTPGRACCGSITTPSPPISTLPCPVLACPQSSNTSVLLAKTSPSQHRPLATATGCRGGEQMVTRNIPMSEESSCPPKASR